MDIIDSLKCVKFDSVHSCYKEKLQGPLQYDSERIGMCFFIVPFFLCVCVGLVKVGVLNNKLVYT